MSGEVKTVEQHTPGPWELSYDKGSGRDIVSSLGSLPICTVRISWVGDKQYHANARLIAAAPDLLAVLQELRECADYWSEYDVPVGIVSRIDAALGKARSPEAA